MPYQFLGLFLSVPGQLFVSKPQLERVLFDAGHLSVLEVPDHRLSQPVRAALLDPARGLEGVWVHVFVVGLPDQQLQLFRGWVVLPRDRADSGRQEEDGLEAGEFHGPVVGRALPASGLEHVVVDVAEVAWSLLESEEAQVLLEDREGVQQLYERPGQRLVSGVLGQQRPVLVSPGDRAQDGREFVVLSVFGGLLGHRSGRACFLHCLHCLECLS